MKLERKAWKWKVVELFRPYKPKLLAQNLHKLLFHNFLQFVNTKIAITSVVFDRFWYFKMDFVRFFIRNKPVSEKNLYFYKFFIRVYIYTRVCVYIYIYTHACIYIHAYKKFVKIQIFFGNRFVSNEKTNKIHFEISKSVKYNRSYCNFSVNKLQKIVKE